MPVILPRNLYLTADKSRIVEEGDPEARWVLGGPGSAVPDDEAKRLGLEEYLQPKDTRPLELPEEPPIQPDEPKSTQPPANKARYPKADK